MSSEEYQFYLETRTSRDLVQNIEYNRCIFFCLENLQISRKKRLYCSQYQEMY